MKLQFGRRNVSDFVCDVFHSAAISATKWLRSGVAALLIHCIVPFGVAGLYAQQPPPANPCYTQLDYAQLDQLVAPIALYPDSLVAQILAAATYPSQVVEAH
jgi:hypothetical protein